SRALWARRGASGERPAASGPGPAPGAAPAALAGGATVTARRDRRPRGRRPGGRPGERPGSHGRDAPARGAIVGSNTFWKGVAMGSSSARPPPPEGPGAVGGGAGLPEG